MTVQRHAIQSLSAIEGPDAESPFMKGGSVAAIIESLTRAALITEGDGRQDR